MLPYIIWGVALLLIFPESYIIVQFFTGMSHLWFLMALMLLFVIVQFTRPFWEGSSFKKGFLVFLIFLVLRLVALNGVHGKVLMYMPFFILGMMSHRFHLTERIWHVRYKVPMLMASLVLIFLAWTIFYYSNHAYWAKSLASLIIAISAMILILIVHAMLEKRALPQSHIIDSLDRNSMGIYILHHIFIVEAFCYPPVCAWLEIHSLIAPAVLFLLVLPVSWLLSGLICRTRLSFIFG